MTSRLQVYIMHLFFSDMAAIPDFAAGAMENWGLILYRETALLYDPRESSTGNKERVAVVVSHELAHQVATGSSLQDILSIFTSIILHNLNQWFSTFSGKFPPLSIANYLSPPPPTREQWRMKARVLFRCRPSCASRAKFWRKFWNSLRR